MGDAFLENRIRLEADGVRETLALQKPMYVRSGESAIALEIAAKVSFPLTLDHGFKNIAPAVGAVDVAGAQGTPLQITTLVEQKQRVIASAAKVAVVCRSLLLAMGRADAAVHVENDHLRRTMIMNTVNQLEHLFHRILWMGIMN